MAADATSGAPAFTGYDPLRGYQASNQADGGEMIDETFLAELDRQIAEQRQEAKDARLSAPNSYGHGYETGFLEALKQLRQDIAINLV